MKVRPKRSGSALRMVLPGVVALVTLASCVGGEPEVWPEAEWGRAVPQKVGLRAEPLDELVALIREGERFPELHSLLIVRNGKVVVEEYFDGHTASELHPLQSVTKSLTSAAVGIAMEEGTLALDDRIVTFFPDLDAETREDTLRRRMAVEDLLTMRSGTDYREGFAGSPHDELSRLAKGWDRFYLHRPVEVEPGTRFMYDSGGVILLSSVLNRTVGSHVDAFLAQHVFAPLGIERWAWLANQEGHPHAGGGLSLRSRDLARFGLLYLRKGRWKDRQVVPASWVRQSMRRHVALDGMGYTTGYGYLWWILHADPQSATGRPIYAAMGVQGQYLFVVPEHDLVVVVTGGTTSQSNQIQPVLFLYSHILPAVH